MIWVEGGVTAARGFLAHGVAARIKKHKKDLALVLSQEPAVVAGVFTTNRVKAAPVLLTQRRVASRQAQAIVVNSGNANACTGPEGMEDAELMARAVAEALSLPEERVLVSSTGVIGERLPVKKIIKALPELVQGLSREGHAAAAEAIMTTDTTPKEAALEFFLEGYTCRVGGMAKGSGMIHPCMATMLAFITTDVAIAPGLLQQALSEVVEDSFNSITVDGDTSTNDMVLVLANGQAANPPIEEEGLDYLTFKQALYEVCVSLARQIARDGEGATKLIEVRVEGALTVEEARRAARAVAASNLVKAAVFGEDPNWGRILCALGYSGARFEPEQVSLWLGPVQVVAAGRGVAFDEEEARSALASDPVSIRADLGAGSATATAWGCDLTYDYVRINAHYRT
ncbi:bifunctional glutamate N-acetyltransferase/amino-acid acetyltransferase ArgJ [Desulfothermobacter acidiphilus]|uniref:bifunctional glutamate N-acetyltransferase/amino-acid acetyltransferase ArgJ n=1 Tax=Desulfothermobacter acidiphilus TaxID=1938353 RepID=UPI003F8C3E75